MEGLGDQRGEPERTETRIGEETLSGAVVSRSVSAGVAQSLLRVAGDRPDGSICCRDWIRTMSASSASEDDAYSRAMTGGRQTSPASSKSTGSGAGASTIDNVLVDDDPGAEEQVRVWPGTAASRHAKHSGSGADGGNLSRTDLKRSSEEYRSTPNGEDSGKRGRRVDRRRKWLHLREGSTGGRR